MTRDDIVKLCKKNPIQFTNLVLAATGEYPRWSSAKDIEDILDGDLTLHGLTYDDVAERINAELAEQQRPRSLAAAADSDFDDKAPVPGKPVTLADVVAKALAAAPARPAVASAEAQLRAFMEVEKTPEVKLDAEQEWAAETVMDLAVPVMVLTGAAGTGKSTIINHLKALGRVTVCATTGKAAMNVGGCTLDTLFNFSRDTWKFRSQEKLAKNMSRCANTILIDEASMIGVQMASLVNDAATMFNKRIILVGDWGQARPVKDLWPMRSALFANAQLVKLMTCHRQKEGAYLGALNNVRVGRTSEADEAVFKSRVVAERPNRDFPGFCMFATNKSADHYNTKCLGEHCAATNNEAFTFATKFEDCRDQGLQDMYPLDDKRIAKIIDDSPFAHNEDFAVGCKVVITKNIDNIVFNGDVGNIVELDTTGHTVVVEVRRRGYTFSVRLEEGEMETVDAEGRTTAKLRGYPIRLGYGVTIHKSQGMTVDSAWVDMESIGYFPKGGRHGLAYVALSRTRTLEGLMISSWHRDVVEVDEEVRAWL